MDDLDTQTRQLQEYPSDRLIWIYGDHGGEASVTIFKGGASLMLSSELTLVVFMIIRLLFK